jgi:hypothetical protein
MRYLFKVGEEVTFRGLVDLRLIVEGVDEIRSSVRCKYFDDHLQRFIKLTLPAESLTSNDKNAQPSGTDAQFAEDAQPSGADAQLAGANARERVGP